MSFPTAEMKATQAIKPHRKFKGHTRLINSVMHLTGRQRMMTCSSDGSLREWNLETGEQIGNDWREGERVYAAALSPNGKKIVSGGADGIVKLWDIDASKIIAKWTGHGGGITSVCWNRDGGRILSGSYDGTAMVWDAESGNTILAIKTGHGAVYSAIYSPDETMIASGGRSREHEFIKIWDSNTGKLIAKPEGHTGRVDCLAWTADGKTLISGSYDSSIRTWNTTTWRQINVFTGHTSLVSAIALYPNGLILASASWDKTAQLWNLKNGQPIGTPHQHPDYGQVDCVSFSMDGKLLATGCNDGNAYLWDIAAIVRQAGLDELLLSPNVSCHFLISPYQLNTLS
jgi:WD40 repeat protein